MLSIDLHNNNTLQKQKELGAWVIKSDYMPKSALCFLHALGQITNFFHIYFFIYSRVVNHLSTAYLTGFVWSNKGRVCDVNVSYHHFDKNFDQQYISAKSSYSTTSTYFLDDKFYSKELNI